MNLKAFASLLPLSALTLAPLAATRAEAAPAVTPALPVGTCINLGNTLEPETEGAWGGVPVRQDDLKRIAAAGFTTIRLPVRWHNKSSDKPPYTVDPKWMARVKQIVDWALAENLNVILNSHHFDPIHDDPLAVAAWHGGVWKQIAETFKGYPEDSLWFELENEPHKNFNHTNLLQTLAPALAEVRKLHPTRAVIIGGENWSGIKSLETLPLPDDANIHPTFHYYDPFLYTHQGAEWTKPDMPPVGRAFPLPEDTAQLARDVAAVQAYIARTGKTPFMGEVGAYDAHIPLADRVAYHRTIAEAFKPTGIGMCMWAYTNTFPFFDHDKGEWLPGLRGAIGLKDDTTAPPAPKRAAATPAPASSGSGNLPPELAAFDAQVPGDLINDPTRIDWASYGPELEAGGRQAADIPGGGAARVFTVKSKGAFPYTSAATIPLLDVISSGEQVTVGFYARAVSSERSDGKGLVGVRFQENAAPYGGFGDTNVLIGKDWQWYEVTAKADKRIRKADAIVTLQLAGAKQVLEIGQTIVVKNAATIQTTQASSVAPALKDAAGLEMPDAIRSLGQLVNDPTNRSWANGGAGGTWQGLDVPEIWLQKATRFASPKVGANRWDLVTGIPILPDVKEGDSFVAVVIARTISAATEDGKGLVYARLQSGTPPYEGFGDKAFKLGDRWQMIQLPFTATRGFGAGDANVTLHFAAAAQTIEVGPVYVFKTN
jgi:Cellulase (glycosyl hydrolase family 5)